MTTITWGTALANGIILGNSHFQVTAIRGKESIKVNCIKISPAGKTGGRVSRILDKIESLPVIGSVFEVIEFIASEVNFLLLVVWQFILLHLPTQVNQSSSSKLVMTIMVAVGAILFFSTVVMVWQYLRSVDLLRYHSIEHKLVNCLEADKKVSMDNLRLASKVHLGCGSFLILFSLPFTSVFLFFLGWRWMIASFFLGLACAIELRKFLVRHGMNSRNRIVPFIQNLACWEPREKHYEVGMALWIQIDEMKRSCSAGEA